MEHTSRNERINQLCSKFDERVSRVGVGMARAEFAKRLAELEGEIERLSTKIEGYETWPRCPKGHVMGLLAECPECRLEAENAQLHRDWRIQNECIADQHDKLARLRSENESFKQLIKDTVYGMECPEICDSYGHDENCPVANPEVAWRQLREENTRLRAENELLLETIDALQPAIYIGPTTRTVFNEPISVMPDEVLRVHPDGRVEAITNPSCKPMEETTMPEEETSFEERVHQFNTLKLPGQPMSMHMGTSYLVNDLWGEVQKLRKERDQLSTDYRELSVEGSIQNYILVTIESIMEGNEVSDFALSFPIVRQIQDLKDGGE